MRVRWIAGAVAVGLVLMLAGPAAAKDNAKLPGYDEAKTLYERLQNAADDLNKAGSNCGKADKPLVVGMDAWNRTRELGIDKAGWWKKSKMDELEKAQIELLFNTSRAKFVQAVGEEAQRCNGDSKFQTASKDVTLKSMK